jgi:hypothetical protein
VVVKTQLVDLIHFSVVVVVTQLVDIIHLLLVDVAIPLLVITLVYLVVGYVTHRLVHLWLTTLLLVIL